MQLLDCMCSDGQPDSHPASPIAQWSLSAASMSCLAGQRVPPAASSLSTANAVMRILTATQLPLRSLCPANRSGFLQQGASTTVVPPFQVHRLQLARQAAAQAATGSTLFGATISPLHFFLLHTAEQPQRQQSRLRQACQHQHELAGWHRPPGQAGMTLTASSWWVTPQHT